MSLSLVMQSYVLKVY